ncbi:MAG: 30S ribosomal protein S4 [Patescibacteria group bacterium]|nr:30S ribosomal protein S4 [Patescibacteria group bacterium]
MSRRLESKCKQCRREGNKLYLKGERCAGAKCAMIKRSYKPGAHGPTSRTRPTPYGLQLREKQKAKETYGMMERQFRNYFEKAKKSVGDTTSTFVQMLEMRLDNVVYRLGFGKSRQLARQLVGHGHVTVNGKKVTIPSYQVKAGDIISLAKQIQKSKLFADDLGRIEKVQPPGWLNLDAKALTGKVLTKPEGEDLRQNFDPKLIVEFYSR